RNDRLAIPPLGFEDREMRERPEPHRRRLLEFALGIEVPRPKVERRPQRVAERCPADRGIGVVIARGPVIYDSRLTHRRPPRPRWAPIPRPCRGTRSSATTRPCPRRTRCMPGST